MKHSSRKQAPRVNPPDLPADLEAPPEPLDRLERGDRLTELAINGWDVSGQSAEGMVWDQLVIERGGFAGTALRRLRARDVRLAGCDLSNAEWSYSVLERVEVLDGRLTGLRLIETRLDDVRLVECKADFSLFRSTRLHDVRLEDCVMREADFAGAELKGVAFPGCDLQGVNFTGARLHQVDFRGARLEGAIFRAEDLQGAILDRSQVLDLSLLFAQLLGITVVE